ncbi:MAG: hypothetical protein IPI32_09955 [Austwickia sp.]|nr:hypothetical protein [Austwickia sp.]MBK8436184.1 hypothetical protein [Austwickia sp.]MBK9101865.1 hypothetical protein [Austwickia sp.]
MTINPPDPRPDQAQGPARRTLLAAGLLCAASAVGGASGWWAGRAAGRPSPSVPAGGSAVPTSPGAGWRTVAAGQDIAAAVRAGAAQILLGPGEYPVRDPIALPRGGLLRGTGQATRLVATRPMTGMVLIGAGEGTDGISVESLVLDCDQQAQSGVIVHVDGNSGNYQGEPDPVIRLDNLWVYDSTGDGMRYHGPDTRSCHTSRVRVRRAGGHGMAIEASDSWWVGCEATTLRSDSRSAGFHIAGTNNFFSDCKAWYCRDYGWHVRGTRNKFTGCESQDTRSHGWFIEYDKNAFVACVADTAGMYDVGGTPRTADGFHVLPEGNTSLVGCQAFDRQPGRHAAQQRYGFHVRPALLKSGLLVAPTGWGNLDGLVGP